MLLSVFMFFMREFQVPTANSGSRRKIESYFIAEKVARRPIFAATILPAKLLHTQKECSCLRLNGTALNLSTFCFLCCKS